MHNKCITYFNSQYVERLEFYQIVFMNWKFINILIEETVEIFHR